MATLKWFKNKVKSGDIVSFSYKNKKRHVIIMECPNDGGRSGKFISKDGKRKKFLHGIEIPISDKHNSKVKNIIKKMGGTRLLFESIGDQQFYQVNFGNELKDIMNARTAYEKVKSEVEDMGIYKTYDWSKITSISLNNSISNLEDLINPRYKIKKKK